MKNLNVFVILFFGVLALSLTTSCGGGKSTGTATDSTQVQAAPENGVPAEQMALGKAIYDTKCKACHQPDGKGLAPAFPPLAGSDYLLSDKKRAVEQALNGSNKEITVNGVVFKGLMPPQVGTIDSAVAVINYVLNSFGNNGGVVKAEELQDVTINPR